MRLPLYLVIVLALGCVPNNASHEVIIIEDGLNYYGKKINDKKAVGLAEFDILANNTDTLSVKLKAGVSEVCQDDGCWFRINLHNGRRMVVHIKDEAFVIPIDVAGKHVMVEGYTYLESVSENVMKKYASQAGELQWIIDTIQGEHLQRMFVASSVVITE